MTAAARGLGLSLGLKRIQRNRGSAKRNRYSRPRASPCPSRAPNESTTRTMVSPMNPNPEEILFALALQKPAEKRATFLEVMCEGDSALHARLEALLAAHEQPDNLVPTQAEAARPTIEIDLAEAPDEAVGQTLGRYKLLERVGEGGCGVVYVAEQTEPVRRRVALKVIKLGMDTKQVVARFEAERQAL